MTAISESVAARPNGPLRDFVREHHGYRQRGIEPGRHLGMPSPYLTVIFTLDEPVQVARHVDGRRPPGRYDALIGGLHAAPALVVHDGAQSGIQLQLSPLAARPLLGLPAGELASVDGAAADVLGAAAVEVSERVRAAGSWGERFAVLDSSLAALLDLERGVAPEVRRAWALLLNSGGTTAIADVAAEVGWSERHLAAQFGVEIGLTPKLAARVIRFDRARRRLERQVRAGRPDLAGLAAACGYFDQAHLVRDWKQFTGLAPTAWIAHEFRNFQAVAADGAQGWAS